MYVNMFLFLVMTSILLCDFLMTLKHTYTNTNKNTNVIRDQETQQDIH